MSKIRVMRGQPETQIIDMRKGSSGTLEELEPAAGGAPEAAVVPLPKPPDTEPAPAPAEPEPPEEAPELPEAALAAGDDVELALRRAQIYAICRISNVLETVEMEQISAWVEKAPCGADRDLRMLCVDLLGKHLKTGYMNVAIVLQVLQRVHGFAVGRPDTSGE